jgi:NAD(P)-dependent dehydrogenase (short-subunit alcohol dehydrogenase family)
MSKLIGKIAFISGGTTGLGFATAERFLSEGAEVVITGRRQAELGMSARGNGRPYHGGCRHSRSCAPSRAVSRGVSQDAGIGKERI